MPTQPFFTLTATFLVKYLGVNLHCTRLVDKKTLDLVGSFRFVATSRFIAVKIECLTIITSHFFSFFRYEKAELHEMQDELEDLRDCGVAGCRPKFIQALANIKVSISNHYKVKLIQIIDGENPMADASRV